MFYFYLVTSVLTVLAFVLPRNFFRAPSVWESNRKKKKQQAHGGSSRSANENQGDNFRGTRYEHIPLSLDYGVQSLVLDHGPTRTSIYASLPVIKGEVVKHIEVLDPEATTLLDVMVKGGERNKSGRCLGDINSSRTGMTWLSFPEVLKRSKHLADGFLQLGLKPGPSSKVGIFSKNSAQYLITELACYRHSMVGVPMYASYGAEVCGFIAGQCEITTIYADTVERVEGSILDQLSHFSTLKTVILGENFIPETELISLKQRAKLAKISLYTVAEVEALGERNPSSDLHLPKAADLALICYTSGSTGAPKGVLMSHRNVVADFSAVHYHVGDFAITEADTIVGFLPLGHMFERICEYACLQKGGSVGYASGDPLALVADLQLIKPTIMPAVPRMLNRVYARIKETVSSSCVKSLLFSLAVSSKRAQFTRGSFRSDTFWDRLVFRKIHALLGGRVRFIPLGSAPISDAVLEYLRCCLGCQIMVGYGTTEVSSACTLGLFGDLSLGNVGVPLPSCSMKLVDVPEMDYYVASSRCGEVCIKGSIVFSGYYKDEERTREVLDPDGWYHTGDIGRWNANGTLTIVDRMKDIFKLSQGEYVVPGKVENVYLQNAAITQIFLYGDSLKSAVVAVVVPNPELVDKRLTDKEDELKEWLLEELAKTGRAGGLKSFEIIKAVEVWPKGWTIEDGLLTPTMKNKRFVLRKFFRRQIEQMYEKLE